MNIDINNAPEIIEPYVVVRQVEDGSLWFYGQYDDLDRAKQVADKIGNGLVLDGMDGGET